MPHVLIVVHEPSLADALERILSNDYSVSLARTAVDALDRLAASPPVDVVLCEVDMPDMTGAELLERAQSFLPDAGSRFLFMSGRATARGRAQEILEALANSPLETAPVGVIDVASLWSGGLPPSMA
jgi:CheY-like chemotaxis protein